MTDLRSELSWLVGLFKEFSELVEGEWFGDHKDYDRDRARADAIIALSDWQPIETAPKDGTPVMLFARSKLATAPAPVVGWMIDGEWIECCFAPNRPVGLVPTHWQPLPEPPTT